MKHDTMKPRDKCVYGSTLASVYLWLSPVVFAWRALRKQGVMGREKEGRPSLSLSLAFLLPITPLAPLRKYKERQLGTSLGLLRKRNLSPVSKFCQAAPVSLFWAYNELPEHFEFPFNLIGKSTMAFYQANHSAHSNPGALVGGPNWKRISALFCRRT